MNRRQFIGGAAAFAAFGQDAFAGAGEPLLKLGMLSDVHLLTRETGKGLQNCLCFEPALRYFDARKADGVLICGDLTDFGTTVAFKRFVGIWNMVFPGNRRSDGEPIKPLFIFGDHDMGGYMYKLPFAKSHCVVPGELDDIFCEGDVGKLWDLCFHEKWAPIQVKELKGYKFILAHHPRHTPESDNGNSIPGLAEFMAKEPIDPTKPFFFVQHRVFKDTVSVPGARCYESGKTTAILKKYPNAIAVCGHGHLNAADDLNLWQGEFTAIEVPSINYCQTRKGRENGYVNSDVPGLVMPKANIRKSWQGMFGTMYADRFVVERRDFLNEAPLGPNWVIPLPSPDGSASAKARAAKAVPPQFPAGAKITVRELKAKNREGQTTEQVYVSFPVANSTAKTPRAYDYEVLAIRDGKPFIRKQVYSRGQFWTESKDTSPVDCAFAKTELPADWKTAVKFAAAPRDSFGNRGKAIS